MFCLVFMAEANLNKAHQVLTYLILLFFPTILSWLLTNLAEVSHSLMRRWYVARIGGTKNNTINLIVSNMFTLRLCSGTFLHTMSLTTTHNHITLHTTQRTSPPWWWSCLPLQQRGFNESTPPKGRVAWCIMSKCTSSAGF
jgi:hypothetical protein